MSYTPGLHGKQLLPRDVHALIHAHGWQEPLNMARFVATIEAESSFWTEAVGTVNDNGSQDFGLFQLNDGHWSRFAPTREGFIELAFSPEDAAMIARILWNDDKRAGGNGFRPWAAYTTGAYKSHLPSACRALTNFAAVKLIGQPIL